MKVHTLRLAFALALASALNLQPSTSFAQGTAFTYQGRLNDNGAPANGLYDFRFKLYFDPLGNTQAGSSFITNAIPTASGLFTVAIDFGPGIFTGSNYWLEVDVKTNNAGSYTVLNPLQPITPTPYAVFANTASNLSGTISSANISGTYGNAVTLNNSANSFTGGFTGNGANVTNVNAATLNGYSAGNFWQLGGNTVTGGQFFGSTNNQALAIYIGGQRALLINTNPADSANFIGGSPANVIDAGVEGAVIAGGGTTNFFGLPSSNHLSANFGVIGGGSGNWVQSGADHSAIFSGWGNTIFAGAYESVIAGGENNTNGGHWAYLGGGIGNVVQPGADDSVLGGGAGNSIQPGASESFIGGGGGNIIQTNSNNSVIGGGVNNTIQQNDYEAVIAGGWTNTIQSNSSQATIAGGVGNVILSTANVSFIGGGQNNTNGGWVSAIAGGQNNAIQSLADHSAIAGGYGNTIVGSYAVDVYDFIGSGYGNMVQTNAQFAVIGGGTNNVIAQGTANGTIGGGANNYVNGVSGTVAGGEENQAAAFRDTVGGGIWNRASGGISTVAGGWTNVASGNAAAIGGGDFNVASGLGATVGGGWSNQATNSYATIPGGNNNVAGGTVSFAAGNQAKALHQGAFVWADSQNAPFASTNNDSFNVRAAGGVRFVTGGAGMSIDGTINGNGGGLTGLNASQLSSGTVPLAQLPGAVLTNNESGRATFNGYLDVNGGLIFPDQTFTAYSGSLSFWHSDATANFAVGYAAGENMGFYGGGNSTAVGYEALASALAGSGNTALGTSALFHLGGTPGTAGGTNNLALGYQAGFNYTANESSNIDIGNIGVTGENYTIHIGTPGIQTTAYIAGTINGDGGGLTNLNAAQVTGSFTKLAVNGSQSGTFNSPLVLMQNSNTSGNTSPALRVIGAGNSPNGVLSVSSQGTGLLAQFGNAGAFVADITTNGTMDAAGFNGGTLRVGSGGTTFTTIQSGQAIMPSSSTVQTNFTITFPQAFTSTPKILVSAANDPSFQGVSDTFAVSVSSNSVSAFRVNVVRVDAAIGWSQQLRINWQAWQ